MSSITETHFGKLLDHLKTQLTELNSETKRRITHALIQRVVITQDGFELHYFAGSERLRLGPPSGDPQIHSR